MSLSMRWVGESDFDRVAETRAKCYGGAFKDFAHYAERLREDRRAVDGDYLLAEKAGAAVGTATSLSLSMWIRGGRVPCQGVGWVGTIKTQRRASVGPGRGIASQVMHETLRLGRERGQVVSALMPFRGSFYDHFGYGIVERMAKWTIPISTLPTGEFEDVRFFEPGDRAALAACRQRCVESGQCDIERSPAGWDVYLKRWEDGLIAVDRQGNGPILGYLAFSQSQKDGKDSVDVTEAGYDDIAGLRRLLHFLASLRDQYFFVTMMLPSELPLHRILRETQLPHRPVNHAHASVQPFTRMSIRVLDHKRLIEAMRLPPTAKGRVIVGIQECEGRESRIAIEMSEGRASVAASEATPAFECPDRIWSAIVTGDLPATTAVELGLASAKDAAAATALDAFTIGPTPFCQEYF